MKSSIKKFCRTVIEDYDTSSLNSVYVSFQEQIQENPEYFQKYNTIDRIGIVYGIFSLGNFGSFDWAERVLPNLYLVSIFNYQEDDYERVSCEDCSGDGISSCENCNGNGYAPCDNCEGEGDFECETCGGGGEVDGEECEDCGGDGRVDCSVCDTESTVPCSQCEGNGNVPCETCDETGEVETERLNYNIYNYLIFDKNLLRFLQERNELDRPIGKNLDFLDKVSFLDSDKVLVLSNYIGAELFADFVEPDTDYCFYVGPITENIRWFRDTPQVMTSLTVSAQQYLRY